MAKKKEDKIPEDVDAELKSPKFTKSKTYTTSGYVLEINESDKKVDIQVFEPIAGTTILEGLNFSEKINLNDIEKGIICEFQLEELKAPLSKKTTEQIQEQGITLNEIIQFELKEFKVIDENIQFELISF